MGITSPYGLFNAEIWFICKCLITTFHSNAFFFLNHTFNLPIIITCLHSYMMLSIPIKQMINSQLYGLNYFDWIIIICLHIVIWFQVCNNCNKPELTTKASSNYSWYKWFVQLYVFNDSFRIQIFSNRYIWLIAATLTGTRFPGHSGSGSNGNEYVFHSLQN